MKTKFSETEIKKKLAEATQNAKEGNLDTAMVILKEILAIRPDHELSLGMLASIYLQIGIHEKAAEHFQALLEVNPHNPLARFQLGMAVFSQGQPEAALEIWEPMLTIDNEFMANFHSALALIQLGRHPEALVRIDHARQHMPESHPLFPKLLELRDQLTRENAIDL